MAIKIRIDLNWGDTFYIKTDEDQYPHQLVGIVTMPGNDGKTITKFMLSYYGDVVTVWDFETTREPDKNKLLGRMEGEDD